MKIALLGYGKMGKTIEKIALQRKHEVVIKANRNTNYNIKEADVAIDFSVPTAAYTNITNCINNNIPVISGTTGWMQYYSEVIALCKKKKGAFLYASNFSLGVTIFFELNTYLAKMMQTLEDYNVAIEEIHHTEKLDAPSGTAITLANDIIKEHRKYEDWKLNSKQKNTIPITAIREENVTGTHTISYTSTTDVLSIKHIANSRQGFATGAVIAAEWIIGKQGVFSMKDVLNIL